MKGKDIFRILYMFLEKNIKKGYIFKSIDLGKLSYDKIRYGYFKNICYEYYNNLIETPIIGYNNKGETIMFLFFHIYLKNLNNIEEIDNVINEKYTELCNDVINSKYTNWINIKEIYILMPNYVKINKLEKYDNFIYMYYEEDIINEYNIYNLKMYKDYIKNNNIFTCPLIGF